MSTSASSGRPGRRHGYRDTHRKRKWSGPFEGEGNRALADYLREVGATPLMEREHEAEYAKTLHDSREEFAALVLRLPPRFRGQVLNGNPDGPDSSGRWKLQYVDECYGRMVAHLGKSHAPEVARIVHEAGRHKERIDAARDALVLANLRFVAHLARQMTHNGASYLDLIQEGNLGLMEAVERFEYKRGYRFSTYAFWWIRKALHLQIGGKSRMIYIPAHVRDRVAAVHRASVELAEAMGSTPTTEEVAERLCLPVDKVRQLLSLSGEPAPLETLDENGWVRGPLASVADTEGGDPLQATLDRELRRKILACLQVLNRRQRAVIRLRFGIGRKNRLTLKQVGRVLNLSRERVRQIELSALQRLQDTPEARSLGGRLSEH